MITSRTTGSPARKHGEEGIAATQSEQAKSHGDKVVVRGWPNRLIWGFAAVAGALTFLLFFMAVTKLATGAILSIKIISAPQDYAVKAQALNLNSEPPPPPYVPPAVIKGVYSTATTALSKRFDNLRKLIQDTELNAVVINVNDIGLDILAKPAMAELVRLLNTEGVHTIARIVVFQNEPLVAARPELALKTPAGNIWRDGGGHRWLDPASDGVRQEILKVSESAAAIGFRELNYDYIRFPSDGAVASAVYPAWRQEQSKSETINSFAKFMRDELKRKYPDIILTVDIFAHTILVENDAGIGQKFTEIVDYFDATCPMVYPSHYRAGNFGYANPAANPYGVVFGTMKKAKEKLIAAGKPDAVLRPWLQDFNMGALYTAAMVKQEIKAVEDAGYSSGWLLWNPSNIYTRGALQAE